MRGPFTTRRLIGPRAGCQRDQESQMKSEKYGVAFNQSWAGSSST